MATAYLVNQGTKLQETEPIIFVEERRPSKYGDDVIRYKRGKFLGKGGFAKCYEFIELDENGLPANIVAGKVVSKSTLKPRSLQKLKTEIAIHRSLSHQHIVQFEHSFEDNENSMMELLKKRKRLTEAEARYYMLQIVDAVKYMHDEKVIHRDLKLGNLFLNNMQVKIGDFGLAAKVEYDGEKKKTICGTPNYIAPEILLNTGHSYEVDTWAIGVILYTFLVGTPPFETSSVEQTYNRIKANIYSFPEDAKISESARSLIKQILQSLPQTRPNLNQIRNHRWFSEGSIPKLLPESALNSPPKFRSPISEKSSNSHQNVARSPLSERTNTMNNQITQAKRASAMIYERGNIVSYPKPPSSNSPQKVQTTKGVIQSPNHSKRVIPVVTSTSDIEMNYLTSQMSLNSKNEKTSSPNVPTMSSLEYMHKNLSDTFQFSKKSPILRSDALSVPSVWVMKWVDYSNKYGLGYELSDGTFGAVFNDKTRIVLSPNEKFTEYYEVVETPHGKKTEKLTLSNISEPNNVPANLQKKITLLNFFKSYLSEQSANKKSISSVSSAPLLHVQKWLRTKHAIILRLSNKTVQVNFFDHSKLLLSADAQVLTFVNKKGEKNTYLLSEIGELGNSSQTNEVVNRLKYTRDILLYMISSHKKSDVPN